MEAGERLKSVEGIGLLKSFGVQFDRRMRRIDAGTAAGGFLRLAQVGSAVSAEKKFGVSTGGGRDQRLPMHFTLQQWQAVVMRPQAAVKQRIAIE